MRQAWNLERFASGVYEWRPGLAIAERPDVGVKWSRRGHRQTDVMS
jgi:hypothetical protein